MQRSRLLGNNMGKQWEAERRGAKREQVRLNNGIQELEDAQHYHMDSMTKEQKRLQRDLMSIKQAAGKKTSNVKNNHQKEMTQTRATNTGKSGQPVASPEGPVMAPGSSIALQMRINDFVDGVKKGNAEHIQRNGSDLSLLETSITDNKQSPSRRLSVSFIPEDAMPKKDHPGKLSGLASGPANPQLARHRRGSFLKDKISFDEEVYAPDGGLRTLHTMPDFMDSLKEAKNARYIRHRVKPEYEKELSVSEIFQKEAIRGLPKDKASRVGNTRGTTKK